MTDAVSRIAIGAAVLVAALLTGAVAFAEQPTGGSDGAAAAEGRSVDLASIVAAWPDAYTATGTKSEPLYTEYVAASRSGDLFVSVVEIVTQGDAAGGAQSSAVRVGADGAIEWLAGCDGTRACGAADAVRGFLAPAALLAAERRGALPAQAVLRTLHGIPVACVADAELYPAHPGTAGLDPCFSIATGALLGYWSAASGVFTGPTLSASDLHDRPDADLDLLHSVLP